MWEHTHAQFQELADKCGNVYLAVNYLSRLARKLNYKVPGGVLSSKLLTWALTGDEPNTKFDFNSYYNLSPDIAMMESYLEYVSDPAVKSSVRMSYMASVKRHHLIYSYDTELDIHDQARVRVLLRMIWSENFELKER